MEALTLGTLSLPLAVLLALPASTLIGRVVGELSFAMPLPLVVDRAALGGWCLAVVVLSVLAAVLPARAATARPVHEALARV